VQHGTSSLGGSDSSGNPVHRALGVSNPHYMWTAGWGADYDWVVDFARGKYAPYQSYPGPDKWNLTEMGNLYSQQVKDTVDRNATGVAEATQLMNEIANQGVMYLWTVYQQQYLVMTSNVNGFVHNPAVFTDVGTNALQYFSTLY